MNISTPFIDRPVATTLLTIGFALAGAVAMSLALVVSASASDNKIALIPGGPHPYFAPWEQAAADAAPVADDAFSEFQVSVAPARNKPATRSGTTRSVTYSRCTTTGSVYAD